MRLLLLLAVALLGCCAALAPNVNQPSSTGLLKVQLSFPTGLHFSDFTDRCDKRSIFCILQHNSISLAPRHQGVHRVKNVLSDEVCDDIIVKAEAWASANGGWSVDRHLEYPTTDLPLQAIFGSFSALHGTVSGEFLPRIADAFGLTEDMLRVGEIFIAKYEAQPGKQNKLAAHVDGTPFSFVLALNDPNTFVGGGTRFVNTGVTYRAEEKGTAFLFSGKNKHEGVATTLGTRYIMTGFCNYLQYSNSASFADDYDCVHDGSAGSQLFIGDVVRGAEIDGTYIDFTQELSEHELQQQLRNSSAGKSNLPPSINLYIDRHEDNRYLVDKAKTTLRKLAVGDYWSLDDFVG